MGMCIGNYVYVLFGPFIVPPNRFNLLFNLEIFFLEVDKSTFNWVVNYVYQIFIVSFGSIFFSSRFVLTIILMNQSSWVVESVILKVNGINQENEKENPKFDDFFKKTAEEFEDVLEWLKACKDFLRKFFVADLTLLATVFCLYLHSMMISDSGNFQALAFLNELFVFYHFCWMGSKLIYKVSKLSASIYAQNWHLLSVHHQKTLKLILQMSQNVKGFDGVFKTIDLTTFQQVWHFNFTITNEWNFV